MRPALRVIGETARDWYYSMLGLVNDQRAVVRPQPDNHFAASGYCRDVRRDEQRRARYRPASG